MKVDVSMANDQDKFSVNSWWATSPEFVLSALNAQLKSASAIWPELNEWFIATNKKPAEEPAPTSPGRGG
jgi:hypothetical protein